MQKLGVRFSFPNGVAITKYADQQTQKNKQTKELNVAFVAAARKEIDERNWPQKYVLSSCQTQTIDMKTSACVNGSTASRQCPLFPV